MHSPHFAGPEGCAISADFPLTSRDQTRNVILYGLAIGVYYLGAPVLYVGQLHAAVLNRMGADHFVANLPSAVYQWSIPFPVLIAWLFPQPRLLKHLIIAAYLGIAAAGAALAAVMYAAPVVDLTAVGAVGGPLATQFATPANVWLFRGAIIAHGAAIGLCNGVANTLLWELLNRGVSLERRGFAFSIAFGAGPILAVIGSQLTQGVLSKKPGILSALRLDYPWSFVALFAATVPCMAVAIAAVIFYRLPTPEPDPPRQPFFAGVFGGIGEFLLHPLIRWTMLAYLLVYGAHEVMNNFTLYTPMVLSGSVSEYLGTQNTFRFGFKVVAGFLLGWLLARTNPKAGLIVTGLLMLAGTLWGMYVPDLLGRLGWAGYQLNLFGWHMEALELYLVAFGLLGAGELMGLYYPNYVMCCSRPEQVRRNMAYTNMLTLFVGFFPPLYGIVADRVAKQTGEQMAGLQASFQLGVAFLLAGLLITQFLLPARPTPLVKK